VPTMVQGLGHALDRVFGQLLLVAVCEVLFFVLVLQAAGPWYEQRYGVLAGLVLGALGAPLTILVPFLLSHDNGFASIVLLVAAPVVNLLLRFLGVYLRADQARIRTED
jgi:hypothetical protein